MKCDCSTIESNARLPERRVVAIIKVCYELCVAVYHPKIEHHAFVMCPVPFHCDSGCRINLFYHAVHKHNN